MTASEKDIKNKEKIKTLLDAAWEPQRVAVIQRVAEDVKKRIPTPSLGETDWQIRPLNKQLRAWG